MKPRWLILCLTLTVAAVVPGLLDAQFRPGARPCPSCMQVQTITKQWQNTYASQQKAMVMQQQETARIQTQQQQIKMQSQQGQTIQNRPAQITASRNTLQYGQATIMKPVGGTMTAYGQQTITSGSAVIPRGYGGTIPTAVAPIISTQKHTINTMSQLNRITMV
ncbi:MAG TPA: hypothetical protein VEL76_40880, partial [Gemmataceae bacterium]|nr:hypothetical protein [Gemmataceae bacterium]